MNGKKNLWIILLLTVFFASPFIFSVDIFSFTPSTGWASTAVEADNGTLVRIRGMDFDPLPENNEVYFSDASGYPEPGVITAVETVFSPGSIYRLESVIGSPGDALGELNHPYDIAVNDTTREIYVVNQFNHRIEVFDDDGTPLRQIGAGILSIPWGVALDSTGNVYVSDVDAPGGDRIAVFTAAGALVRTLAEGDLDFPQDLAVQDDGSVYVVEGGIGVERFTKLNAAGGIIYRQNGPPDLLFENLTGITLYEPPGPSDARVYVADMFNQHVYIYTTDGTYLDRWDIGDELGWPESFLGPGFLAVDYAGFLYIQTGDTVTKFDREGNFEAEVLDLGLLPPAEFRAIDDSRRLYAVQNLNAEICCLKVFWPTDTEELLVRVPAGAETGPIAVICPTPWGWLDSAVSIDDFHVLEVVDTTQGETTVSQGLPTAPFIAGKPIIVYTEVDGFFGHPGRDAALLTMSVTVGDIERVTEYHAGEFEYTYDLSAPHTRVLFHIPRQDLVYSEVYQLELSLTRDGSSINVGDNWSTNIALQGTQGIDLVFSKLTHIPNDEWDTLDAFSWFNMFDFLYGIETFARTYPIDPGHVSFHFVDGRHLDCLEDLLVEDSERAVIDAETIRIYYSYIPTLPEFTGDNTQVHSIGMLDIGTIRDRSSYLGWSMYNEPYAVTYFDDIGVGSYNTWGSLLSHEVGHSYGLVPSDHSNFDPIGHHSVNFNLSREDGGPFEVWESLTDRLFDGPEWAYSIMYNAGGGVDSQIAFFENSFDGEEVDYPHLLERLIAERVMTPAPFLPPGPGLPAPALPKMVVIGTIDGAVASIIESYCTEEPLPLTQLDPSSDYSIVFIDNIGRVSAEDPFAVEDASAFGVVRPCPADTARVQIRLHGHVIIETTVSSSPPDIGSVYVSLMDPLPVITWQTSDPDGDPLRYDLLYSRDGGTTFHPIASGIEGTHYKWDHTLTGGGEHMRIKVIASDGFHRTPMLSYPFSLPRKAPIAVILTPDEGRIFTEDSTVSLKGTAYDPEDGLLTGNALSWRIGSSVFLGKGNTLYLRTYPQLLPNGEFLEVPFGKGTHTIFLDTTDKDGNITSQEVTIEVVADTDRDGFGDDDERGAGTDPYDPFNRPSRPPVAVQDGQYKGLEGERLSYEATESSDPDSDLLTFSWDFDDGESADGMYTRHTYGDNGNYNLALTAVDPEGLSDSDVETVFIYNEPPTVQIDKIKQTNPFFILPVVHSVYFQGSFTDPGWLDTHTPNWSFGDSTSATGSLNEEHEQPDSSGTVIVRHSYSRSGTFLVKLTVKDDDGDKDSDVDNVTVIDELDAFKIMTSYITKLPDKHFLKPVYQYRKSFAAIFNKIGESLQKEDYNQAVKLLKHELRNHCDGFIGGDPKDDWIITKNSQKDICLMTDDLIDYLDDPDYQKSDVNQDGIIDKVDALLLSQ